MLSQFRAEKTSQQQFTVPVGVECGCDASILHRTICHDPQSVAGLGDCDGLVVFQGMLGGLERQE